MGLFSKEPKADEFIGVFGKMSAEDQELIKQKLFPIEQPAEQPAEPTEETEVAPVEEQQTETSQAVAEQPQVEKAEEKKESFEEMFKKLTETMSTKMTEMEEKFNSKFEELSKPTVERKPFGLSENTKEYKATEKPKETSDDLIKKYFK